MCFKISSVSFNLPKCIGFASESAQSPLFFISKPHILFMDKFTPPIWFIQVQQQQFILGSNTINTSKLFSYEPTGLRDFRPGPTETGLFSHRRWLEILDLGS